MGGGVLIFLKRKSCYSDVKITRVFLRSKQEMKSEVSKLLEYSIRNGQNQTQTRKNISSIIEFELYSLMIHYVIAVVMGDGICYLLLIFLIQY